MIDVMVLFEVDGQRVAPEQVEDEYLAEMLRYTGEQLQEQAQRSLAEARCPQHNQPPRLTVTATYATETEQMELSYHVDSCCQQGLMQAIQALNR